jgi:hypothetical protein
VLREIEDALKNASSPGVDPVRNCRRAHTHLCAFSPVSYGLIFALPSESSSKDKLARHRSVKVWLVAVRPANGVAAVLWQGGNAAIQGRGSGGVASPGRPYRWFPWVRDLFDQGADGKNTEKGIVLRENMPQKYLDE